MEAAYSDGDALGRLTGGQGLPVNDAVELDRRLAGGRSGLPRISSTDERMLASARRMSIM